MSHDKRMNKLLIKLTCVGAAIGRPSFIGIACIQGFAEDFGKKKGLV